jgi:hypothetical protein
MKKSLRVKQRKLAAEEPEPKVGIVWLLDGQLVIDSTPLSEAENYGEFKVHPGNHYAVWSRLQRVGIVPAEMEYEQAPRGRVMYSTRTRGFTFLADRCILKDKGIVRRIMSEMNLPKDTATDTDSHYRCFRCLRRK